MPKNYKGGKPMMQTIQVLRATSLNINWDVIIISAKINLQWLLSWTSMNQFIWIVDASGMQSEIRGIPGISRDWKYVYHSEKKKKKRFCLLQCVVWPWLKVGLAPNLQVFSSLCVTLSFFAVVPLRDIIFDSAMFYLCRRPNYTCWVYT